MTEFKVYELLTLEEALETAIQADDLPIKREAYQEMLNKIRLVISDRYEKGEV